MLQIIEILSCQANKRQKTVRKFHTRDQKLSHGHVFPKSNSRKK